MDSANTDNALTLSLPSRIDSNSAQLEEEKLRAELNAAKPSSLILDASKLEYISSAGLRILLRLRKDFPELRIQNVCSEVYEILEMTGFTEMLSVEKAFRVLSVDGCDILGQGANAKVYRLDDDTVVKVYKSSEGLDEITHERENARLALILGVPTAISYDVVRVGSSFGSVFELLNAHSFSKILADEPERMDWCVKEYVDMLHTIHSISVPDGKLPAVKDEALGDIKRMMHLLPTCAAEKLLRMAEEIPNTNCLIHGDYHTQNIVLASGEVLLIDMDKLSVGHPVFELARIFNAYVGFSEYDPAIVLKFQGFSQITADEFWKRSLRAYLGSNDEAFISSVEDKVRCIAYSDLIDWRIRHTALKSDDDVATVELYKRELIELLKRVDSLYFEESEAQAHADELDIEADAANLQKVLAFVGSHLEAISCPMKARMQIEVAVEEVFVNIASYAYAPENGRTVVRIEVSDSPITVSITFIDHGIPYDPLAKPDPDVTLAVERRQIGGLGIFMTKQLMDDIVYEYNDGRNILTLRKQIGG